MIPRLVVLASALVLCGPAAATLPSLMSPASPAGPSIAHVEPTMGADLLLLALEYPSLARVSVAGMTEQGRPIHMLEVTNFDHVSGEEPYLYVDGTMHGNEEVAGEVAYFAARKLLAGFGTDARATRLVEDARTLFLPIMNADGNLHNPPTRKNANGVDLNRNFPWHWCEQPGASPNPGSQTYCGSAPGSEAETQVAMAVIDAYRPEIAISGHSGTRELLYPWGYTSAPAPDSAMFERLGEKFRAHTGIPASHALYPVTGASRDWTYGNYGVPAFTFEVDNFQATNVLTTSTPSYETRLAAPIEGTLWLLDHAQDMGARIPTPPALTTDGARILVSVTNEGWGDTYAMITLWPRDDVLQGMATLGTPVAAESAADHSWTPAGLRDGTGRLTVTVEYDRTHLHPRPLSLTANYTVVVANGAIVSISAPEP